jgi:AAA15 family ATPase/GTPase
LGGFLKTNVDVNELKVATEWFKNYLSPLVFSGTDIEKFVTTKIHTGELSKFDMVKILKKAGFHISDIVIQEEEREIPDGMIEFLIKKLNAPVDEIRKLEEKGKLNTIVIEFEHTVNQSKYTLPIEFESQGTRRFYGFAGLLALLIKESMAIPIDELDSSLHPDLYNFFILSFLLNSNKSQIIATTHFREFLDNKDMFRNDAIWFTDKSKNSSTELYSLADFDSSVIRNTTNIYNAYKSGKLKAAPNVEDNFIDLNK